MTDKGHFLSFVAVVVFLEQRKSVRQFPGGRITKQHGCDTSDVVLNDDQVRLYCCSNQHLNCPALFLMWIGAEVVASL